MDRLVGNWYVALEEQFQDKVSVFLDRKKVKSLSSKRPKLVSHIYEEWLEQISFHLTVASSFFANFFDQVDKVRNFRLTSVQISGEYFYRTPAYLQAKSDATVNVFSY